MSPVGAEWLMAVGTVNAETFITGVKCDKQRETAALRKWLSKKGKAVKWKC
jgi:hypothetical protein